MEAIVENPTQQEAKWRLQCLQGHLEALIRMTEADEPAPALLLQISALQGGLEKLTQLIVRCHLRDCLRMAASINRQAEYEQALRALEGVYRFGRSLEGERIVGTQ